MFEELFQKFLNISAEYDRQDKLGGVKLHVPIPLVAENKKYSLAALLHLVGGRHIGRPHKILKVSDEGVKYSEIDEAERESLQLWKGPVHSQRFSDDEERVLEISVRVFKCYVSDSRNELVEEYARGFAAITPPEFMFYYMQLNADFLDWLALEAVWKDSQQFRLEKI